jgi:hypothetical protein
MGFLDKLWDETLAGPTPETGLGKLRKYNSFSASSSGARSPPVKDDVPISRSIMIIRTNNANFGGRGTMSEPVSPCSSAPSTPRTPHTPLTRNYYYSYFSLFLYVFFCVLSMLEINFMRINGQD